MLAYYTSITKVEKVFNTGQKPLLVTASDLNDYVVKYSDSYCDTILMTEYLVGLAAKELGIIVPEMAFIQLDTVHQPDLMEHKIRYSAKLDQTLLGFKFVGPELLDLTYLSEHQFKPSQKNIRSIRYQFLEIAFFDMWIANEDRNSNNYNLLLDITTKEQKLIAIDHGCAFNTLNIKRPLTNLTVEDSILSSSLARRIFSNKNQIIPFINAVREKFTSELSHIRSAITEWIQKAPETWNIDKQEWNLFCDNFWLTDDWLKKTIRNFHEIIEIEF